MTTRFIPCVVALLPLSGCVCEGPMCYLSPVIDREAPTIEVLAPEEGAALEAAEEHPLLLWVADDETLPERLSVELYLDDELLDGVTPKETGAVESTFEADPDEHTLLVVAIDEQQRQTRVAVTFTVEEPDTTSGDTVPEDSGG